MANLIKYYVVKKTTDRGITDSIHFEDLDGVTEFETKEAALKPLKKLYDLYLSKNYGKNHNWYEDGFTYNDRLGYKYNYRIIRI